MRRAVWIRKPFWYSSLRTDTMWCRRFPGPTLAG